MNYIFVMMIGATILVVMGPSLLLPIHHSAYAQPINFTASPTPLPQPHLNFTKLYSELVADGNNFTKLIREDKVFQTCETLSQTVYCLNMVDVIYQSPTLLVLDSIYSRQQWIAADLAQKVGYKISEVSVYTTHGLSREHINTEIVMSK